MIHMKMIDKEEEVGHTYDFIKSNSNTYKHNNTNTYFISDGDGTVLVLAPLSSGDFPYIGKLIESVWKDKKFIEVDCFIQFKPTKKD